MANKYRTILWGIIILAFVLRVVDIAWGDTLSDEVYYAFRAIGMMDFDEGDVQTTPWEWFDSGAHPSSTIPWWAHLSFHDHPPLVFLIQHGSIALFGENNFAYRFPSAVFGVGSVALLYLVGRLLFSEIVGLFAAGMLAVTANHVYISRIGMQESFVIFFMLLASYFFLRALRHDSFFIWMGVAVGLGLLTKYTFGIMVAIFLIYLLLFSRRTFFNKKLWVGMAIALLFFSPVLVYNIFLYHRVGHFDFQLSYIFGQHPEVWKVAPGKEIGTFTDRLNTFIPRLIATHSWLFLGASFISLLAMIYSLMRFGTHKQSKLFILIALASLAGLILVLIGTSFRFLTMLTSFLALAAGWGIGEVLRRIRGKSLWVVFIVLLAAGFIFEIFYSINNLIRHYPSGPYPWISSKVREETEGWGYNELGAYFAKEFAGKMPALLLTPRYQFLNDLQDRAIADDKANGLTPYPAMIVYFGNFQRGAKLMTIDRLQVYHGWPAITLNSYFDILQKNGFDYFSRQGFKKIYFVMSTNIEPSETVRQFIGNRTSMLIRTEKGDIAFRVYML